MKINKKALFFDIDGTLFSEKLRQVPQSAVLALKKTMEKGNLTFINTGRTWCQTSKIREEAPVNGLLCGCGTYISVDGKTLYDKRISPERAEKLKEDILRFRMDTVMEGVDACFFRPDGVQTETMRAIRSILDQSGSVSAKNWSDPSFSISKFCVAVGADSDPAGFFETLRDFEVIDRGGGFYECVPMGHSKASAIEWILKQYGIDVPVCAEYGCHGKTRCRAGAVCDVYGEDRGGRWDLPGDGRAGAFVRKQWFGV